MIPSVVLSDGSVGPLLNLFKEISLTLFAHLCPFHEHPWEWNSGTVETGPGLGWKRRARNQRSLFIPGEWNWEKPGLDLGFYLQQKGEHMERKKNRIKGKHWHQYDVYINTFAVCIDRPFNRYFINWTRRLGVN